MEESSSLYQNLKGLFEQCDSDKDGFLGINDLKYVIHELDLPIQGEDQIEQLFQLMDVNNRRMISMSDFIEVLSPIARETLPLTPNSLSASPSIDGLKRSFSGLGENPGFLSPFSPVRSPFKSRNSTFEDESFTDNLKIMEKLVEEAMHVLSSPPEEPVYRKRSMNSEKESWAERPPKIVFEDEGMEADELTEDIHKLDETKKLVEKVFSEKISNFEKEREIFLKKIEDLEEENRQLREKSQTSDVLFQKAKETNTILEQRLTDVEENLSDMELMQQVKDDQILALKKEVAHLMQEKEHANRSYLKEVNGFFRHDSSIFDLLKQLMLLFAGIFICSYFLPFGLCY